MTYEQIYKRCIIPFCRNTTTNAPEKQFFSFSVDSFERKAWNNAVEGLNRGLSSASTLFFCEDHFSFLPARSSALDNLQGYGAVTQSPSWNAIHDAESSLTPSHAASSTPFINYNLTSVDEEDEFLYGDSNSVSEEQISVKEEPGINPSRLDSGWSDEEDPYGEASVTVLNKLNSRLRQKNSDLESRNFSGIKKEVVEERIPEQKYAPHNLTPDHSSLSSRVEKDQFLDPREKSKYHAAAEILKKRIAEKTSNSPAVQHHENIGAFPGIPKTESELEVLKTVKSPSKRLAPTLNKKHVDNIRDYITGARKRPYPPEEFPPEKHPRYEASRSSPSRHYSPQNSSSATYKSRSSHPYPESDRSKYSSSSSRHRSPSYEYEKHHSRYPESRRRYSPSPKRRSRTPDYKHRRRSPERNADYYRHKDRSPKSRRSRSRSPGFYSSRSKTYDKKTRNSPKKSSSKKKEKSNYSSGDSYCSLSISSSSSATSDGSSEDERKTKKRPSKTTPKDNKKHETEVTSLKDSIDTHAKQPESNNLQNRLSNILDLNNSDPIELLKSASSIQHLMNAMPREEQLLEMLQRQMASQQQPLVASDSSTYASPTINIAAGLQMPVIPSSESYVYPTMSAAPVQYAVPQMTGFQPMIPSATFPAPSMAAPSPAAYGPYLSMPSAPSNESQYVSTNVVPPKSVRPSALKTVPLAPSSATSSNITVVPSNLPVQKPVSKPKIKESNDVKIPETKRSVDQKNNFKEKSSDKNVKEKNSSSKSLTESEEKLIEKFKKMKTDRAKALNKAKSASDDLDEMRKLLDETFGKKTSANEKLLYTKCKNQFNLSLDIASQANKDARRADENLSSFRSKLSTPLQQEVSKIKLDPYRDDPVTNAIISCLDQGDHTCADCYITFPSVKEFLCHIQLPEHKQQMEMSKQDWKKDFVKEPKKDEKSDEQKKTVLKPVKGAEFLKPLTGFYCCLCKEVFLEESGAEQHLKGHQHYVSYDNFTGKRAPLYEMKRLFKRYIKMVISTRRKNAEKKKNQEAAEKLSKEILLKEKSKEITYIELEEQESEDFSPSSNQVNPNIKLNLSERDNDKSAEKKNSTKELENKNSAKELENKNSAKFIYIGKAPNYKKNVQEKKSVPQKPWYKRDNILNVKECDASSSSSNVTGSSDKSSQKSQPNEVKPSNPLKNPEKSKFKNDFVEVDITSEKFTNKKSSRFENKNSDTKQTMKSSSNVSNSSQYVVQLSEIELPDAEINRKITSAPDKSSLPSSRNANIPQPMDIDNSQDAHNKSKSEEEKDFLLLGIKKEDFQPLVIPVPPPTSMVSYPILSNVQTLTSNTGSSTTSTSSVNSTILSTLNFSVPPPNIAAYQSNPTPSVYGNQNNTQNVGLYSYPTNNSQMSVYPTPSQVSLQPSYQPIPQFTTPPPVFRNPPPMLPYSNAANMQPATQFSNSNSLPYNSYTNSVLNQVYQPSVYSAPPSNQAHFSVQNVSPNLVPPGSEYDTSFHKNNFNPVTARKITSAPEVSSLPSSTAPSYVHQKKISPQISSPKKDKKVLFKKDKPYCNERNLTVIVSEETRLQANESVSDSKSKNSKEIKISTKAKNKSSTKDDTDKDKTVVGKKKTETAKNTVNVNPAALKTSKIVEKEIGNTTANNEKMNEHSDSEVKDIINECIQEVEKPLNASSSLSVSSASSPVKSDKAAVDSKNTEDAVIIKNSEKNSGR